MKDTTPNPARILVTGGKGFLGNHLVKKLRRLGQDVETFDAVDGQDICNLEQIQEAVKGKQAVFHLAAIADLNWAYDHPLETMKINVEGTWNVAMACLKARTKLYYSSTCCVYGNQPCHPSTEESLPNPAEIYGCTKLAGENVIKGIHYSFGLEYNLMRFATIYGSGAREALGTHLFLKQALSGEPITVHGDGLQTRTLTYVDDLIGAIIALYASGKVNDVWNLTAEEPISALRMAEDIKRITGSKSEIVHIPQRIGQTFHEEISAEKMLKEVGWKARVDWEWGMRSMYEWFISNGREKTPKVQAKSGRTARYRRRSSKIGR